jgi:hypothetical protein
MTLDVRVVYSQAADSTGVSRDVLQVLAHNPKRRPLPLTGCAVALPLGLLVYSQSRTLPYPVELPPDADCWDCFDCRSLAAEAAAAGYRGRVQLVAMFLEDTRFGLRAPEHRSDPFVFDVDRWLMEAPGS